MNRWDLSCVFEKKRFSLFGRVGRRAKPFDFAFELGFFANEWLTLAFSHRPDLKGRMQGFRENYQAVMAFSRVDLIVTICVTAVVLGLLWLLIIPSRLTKEEQCAANLKALGIAAALYEHDNNSRLPYAYIKYDSTHCQVWDSLIFHYIPPGKNGFAQKHLFRCPADTILPKGDRLRRTYAMPVNSMQSDEWPLSSNCDSGVGLWWDRMLTKRRPALTNYISVASTQDQKPGKVTATITMPAINTGMILAPDRTLLLTEHATAANEIFYYVGATIGDPNEHWDKKVINPDQYHGGRIDYLMVDGHVDLLYPIESVGESDVRSESGKKFSNLWTIRTDD